VTDSFEQFVAAVHRRAVAWSLVERTGITLAGAAGVAGVLTVVGVSQEVPAGPIMTGAVLIAVTVGAAWGILRRPNRLDAVMEADRQLNLQDLLSSALLAPTDDFGSAVRVMARRACAKHSPGEIVLHRLGVRAWGGIGLAWAMVVVVSLLAGNGTDTRANIAGKPALARTSSESTPITSHADSHRDTGGSEAASDDFSHVGTPQDSSATNACSNDRHGQPTPVDATGQESSQTNASSAARTPTAGSGDASDSSQTGATVNGTGGHASVNRAPGDGSASSNGTVTSPSAHVQPAPWMTDHWPADRDAALQAVQSGQVPPAYQDLVHDYFISTPVGPKK